MITTPRQLRGMATALAHVQQIAVDVEYSPLVRYAGAVALIQLATVDTVYVIDALAVPAHAIRTHLAPILANPHVLKILHGSDNDIAWLRAHFNANLVNIFDTHVAAVELGSIQPASLAHLLYRYCNAPHSIFATKAAMQTSDWSARPLSPGQLAYAVNDVWYLHFVAGQLVKEMGDDKERVLNVVRRSQLGTLGRRGQVVGGNPTNDALRLLANESQGGGGGGGEGFGKRTVAPTAGTAARLRMAAERYRDIVNDDDDDGNNDQDTTIPDMLAYRVHALCVWRDETARRRDVGVQRVLSDEKLMTLARTADTQAAPTPAVQALITSPPVWEAWLHSYATLVNKHHTDTSRDPAMLAKLEKQAKRFESLVSRFSAKAPVYDNCRMLSMDGQHLCFCDRGKLEWYLRKNLGTLVSDDPPTIRLCFQHNTNDQSHAMDAFFSEQRTNCCVVCGTHDHYLRYRIFPSCYRKHLPVELKSHRSHDVVLLCVACHEIANKSAERVKREIAQEYNVPMHPRVVVDNSGQGSELDVGLCRRSAIVLHKHGKQLPMDRRRQLEAPVRQYLNLPSDQAITPQHLAAALTVSLSPASVRRTCARLGLELDAPTCSTTTKQANAGWHGKAVVEAARERGGTEELLALIKRFREAFVVALRPKFLPKSWNVEHNAARAFGPHSVYHSSSCKPCNNTR